MARVRRAELAAEAHRRNLEQLARLGGEVKRSRVARGWTQAQVAALAGVSRATESRIERGAGASMSMDSWQRIALAVGRPLRAELAADTLEETRDAGHLALQELVLRHARRAGFERSFELPTRPANPAYSVDVGLRHDRRRILILAELWNRMDDIGAAARSTNRKIAEAEQLAIAIGAGRPHRVRAVWIVRATRRNRALVGRYPEVFSARLPGSSVGWWRALTSGAEPPEKPGLLWSDLDATRIYPARRRG